MSAVTVREPKRRHGRDEVRMVWVLSDPDLVAYAGSSGEVGEPWPHLAQVCRIERERVVRRTAGTIVERSREVSYHLTSRQAARADAPVIAARIRGHWGIENKTHHVRDVTFGEDASQIRSGAAPQIRAACCNLIMALLRRDGVANIAAALRTDAGRPDRAVQFVATAGVMK